MLIQFGSMYNKANVDKYDYITYNYYKSYDEEGLLDKSIKHNRPLLSVNEELLKKYTKSVKNTNLLIDKEHKVLGINLGKDYKDGLKISTYTESMEELITFAKKNKKKSIAIAYPKTFTSVADMTLAMSVLKKLPSNIALFMITK